MLLLQAPFSLVMHSGPEQTAQYLNLSSSLPLFLSVIILHLIHLNYLMQSLNKYHICIQ